MQMRLYGISFLLGGAILLIISTVQWLKLLSFKNCEVIRATVNGVDRRVHYSNNHRRVSYSLTVAYCVDGISYERKLACGRDEYELGTERQVEIRYRRSNPKRILLNATEAQARGQRILWLITLLLFVIGVVLLLLATKMR